MRIGVTGSTGLVGSELLPLLNARGHEVVPIVRRHLGTGRVEPGEIAGGSGLRSHRVTMEEPKGTQQGTSGPQRKRPRRRVGVNHGSPSR